MTGGGGWRVTSDIATLTYLISVPRGDPSAPNAASGSIDPFGADGSLQGFSHTQARNLRPTPFLSVPQVVRDLHVEPRFRRAAERRRQTNGKLCAHRGAS